MPELPDVETFRSLVQRSFAGCSVLRVIVADPASLEGASIATVQRRLKGKRLLGSVRHGKYLFLGFGEGCVLVMHFGPAGLLCSVPAGAVAPAYVRFRLDFSNADGLAYVNRRRIGRVRLVNSAASIIAQTGIGLDALDMGFAAFAACLKDRRRAIKALLVDQSLLSGIGNTYSDEILFQARIHPGALAGLLDAGRRRRLFRSMRYVLRTAIELDPTTDDFRARLPSGFLLRHRHPGGHCPRCGTALEQLRVGGHTSTYCPHCQT